jgi:hypothetical protein
MGKRGVTEVSGSMTSMILRHDLQQDFGLQINVQVSEKKKYLQE